MNDHRRREIRRVIDDWRAICIEGTSEDIAYAKRVIEVRETEDRVMSMDESELLTFMYGQEE